MEFFKCKKMTPSITKITDLTQVHMFLIEGKERAVLIDTGTGVGNIKEYVASLTNLPLTVIVTHGHIDHASGAVLFDKVYLNQKDNQIIDMDKFAEGRKQYVKLILGDLFDQLTEKDLPIGNMPEILPLNDGDTFDLGGISVKAIEVPGHTQGMTCILIPEERIIIFGDACNHFTFMFLDESSSIAEYKKSLLNLKKYEDQYDTVYLSHGMKCEAGKEILDNCIELCDVIMKGQADDKEYEFMGTKAYLAREIREDGRTRNGKIGNIVYSKDKIF